MPVRGDAERERDDGICVLLSPTVAHFYISAQRICGVIEVENASVENPDRCQAERFSRVWMNDRDEIVTSNVPDKDPWISALCCGLEHGVRCELDDLVTSHETVMVVERLEAVSYTHLTLPTILRV